MSQPRSAREITSNDYQAMRQDERNQSPGAMKDDLVPVPLLPPSPACEEYRRLSPS